MEIWNAIATPYAIRQCANGRDRYFVGNLCSEWAHAAQSLLQQRTTCPLALRPEPSAGQYSPQLIWDHHQTADAP